jgi:hypothetical protein
MKFPYRSLCRLFLLIGICTISCVGESFASDDWQYWNEFKLKHNINEKIDVHLKLEQRIVDHVGDFALHNYSPGIVYGINKYFDFELNYKYEREKVNEEWRDEHRLEMIPIIKWEWSGYKFNVRNRFEYRTIEGDDKWRWREKLKIKRNVMMGDFVFTPFVSEEIFYDFKEDEFNQNRAAIGFTKEITKSLEIGLYYLRKSNKRNGSWTGVNVLGTEFVMNF